MKTHIPIIPFDSPLRRAAFYERPHRLGPVMIVLVGHLLLLAVLAIRGSSRGDGGGWWAGQLTRGETAPELVSFERIAPAGIVISVAGPGMAHSPDCLPGAGRSSADPAFTELTELPSPHLEMPVSFPESADSDGALLYTVKPGDTLNRIARIQGTSVGALRTANGMKTDFLAVGQKLRLPQ